MIQEDKELIESHIADGDSNREAGDFGNAKISYMKALEEFERAVSISGGDLNRLSEDEQRVKTSILERIAAVNIKLAHQHRELGRSALKSKDYSLAIDEFEEAIELASETDLQFLEDVKKELDLARKKELEHKVYEEVSPFVTRGEEFYRSGNYAEAVLEFQEAQKFLSGFPEDHRFNRYIRDKLLKCRRHLIRPYLTRIYWASCHGNFKKAYEILKRVMMLIDEKDLIYKRFLELIRDQIKGRVTQLDIDEEDVETPEDWAKAIKDYEEALGLYTSFTPLDPLSPVYSGVNIYEDRFLESRRRLAELYRKRGDRMRDNAKFEKAIKNYKEALKLFPKGDKVFHETFLEMKKVRAQLLSSKQS